MAIDAAQVVPAWRGPSAIVTCIPQRKVGQKRSGGMGIMADTGSLDRLTAQDLLIMLWPADLGWPKDTGALADLDPIGADRRPATLR